MSGWWTKGFVLLFFGVGGIAVISAVQRLNPALPETLNFAGGSSGFGYDLLSHDIAAALHDRHSKIEVSVIPSAGSVESLDLLEKRTVDFAIVQNGLEPRPDLAMVANVMTEVYLPITASKEIMDLSDLADQPFSGGVQGSGTALVTEEILERYYHIPIQSKPVSFGELRNFLLSGGGGGASVVTFPYSPKLAELLAEPIRLLPLNHRDALVSRSETLVPMTLPAGFFRPNPPLPAEDYPTVGVVASLVTRKDMPPYVVSAVAEVILDGQFTKTHHLSELDGDPTAFALRSFTYPLHLGTQDALANEPAFTSQTLHAAAQHWMLLLFCAVFMGAVPAFFWNLYRMKRRDGEIRMRRSFEELRKFLDGLDHQSVDSSGDFLKRLAVLNDKVEGLIKGERIGFDHPAFAGLMLFALYINRVVGVRLDHALQLEQREKRSTPAG